MHGTTIEMVTALSPEHVQERLEPRDRQGRDVRLRASVREDPVRAQVRPRNPYYATPMLRGVLERHPDGSVLVGTAREGLLVPIAQWFVFALGALLLLLFVQVLTENPADTEGLVVGGFGGGLLMGTGLVLRRQRPGRFAEDCEELRAVLTARLQE